MQLVRPGIALDSRRFGKRPRRAHTTPVTHSGIADDLRLFALTFAAGFIFVSVFLA